MRPKPDERALLCQEYYEALMPALRHRAERCGYAIAVHGSLKRDIDLVACPWRTVSPISAESLAKELMDVTRAIVGVARHREGDPQPSKKPWGRLAWSFYLTHDDNGPYIDLSVMPMVEEPEPKKKAKRKKGRK